MGYGCTNNCIAEEEEVWCRHHHHRRPCEDCFDPLVLMYIDDNQCSLEDDEEADAECEEKWWDTEGAEENHHHHHHHHHDPCHACHHPHILMYIDDNLCDDAEVEAEYGWEWCIVEDEFGRRRWHKRRRCCCPRVLMDIDDDPCLMAEAEAARDKDRWYREEV